jgi:hypothetical protein
VNRHIIQHHNGESNNVDVKPYYGGGEMVKKARQYIENSAKVGKPDQDPRAEYNPLVMSQASQPSPDACRLSN